MRTIVRAYLLGWMLLSISTAAFSQKVEKRIFNFIAPKGLTTLLTAGSQANVMGEHPLTGFCHEVYEKGNAPAQADAASNSFLLYPLSRISYMRSMACAQIPSLFIVSPQLAKLYDYAPFFYVNKLNNCAEAFLQIDFKTIHITGLTWGRGARGVTGGAANCDYSFGGGIARMVPVPHTEIITNIRRGS